MSGKSLKDLNFEEEVIPKHVSVKEAVFPFEKFQGCDVILGPEMRSTGEVMSISYEFPSAFAIAVSFLELGFKTIATSGTAHFLELKGIPVERVLKMHEGRPHAADMVANGQIHLMLITSSGDALDQKDGRQLRQMALAYKVPVITTVAGALATAEGIKSLKSSAINMTALQDFFEVKDKSSLLV